MDFFMPLLIGILSIFIIMKSAGYAISAISHYARETGISEYFVGFVIVAIGTSFPELSTAIFASIAKEGGLLLGDVLGGSIIDLSIVMGLTAVFGRVIFVRDKAITKAVMPVFVVGILPIIVGFDGMISRFDGIILIFGYIFFMYLIIRGEGKLGHIKKSVKFKLIWKDIVVFGGTLAALLLATRWFVLSSISLAYALNIPVFLMGLVFVSLGTTVPELTVNLKSILRHHAGIAFGDVLGSVVSNITLVLGIAALINPIMFDQFRFLVTGAIMIFGIVLAVVFIKGKKITWKHGLVLVALYAVFLMAQFIVQ